MDTKKIYYRQPELEQYRAVWLTKEVYNILRDQKRLQKISLAKIVCNAIIEKYG
jgi:hypothetical protein